MDSDTEEIVDNSQKINEKIKDPEIVHKLEKSNLHINENINKQNTKINDEFLKIIEDMVYKILNKHNFIKSNIPIKRKLINLKPKLVKTKISKYKNSKKKSDKKLVKKNILKDKIKWTKL